MLALNRDHKKLFFDLLNEPLVRIYAGLPFNLPFNEEDFHGEVISDYRKWYLNHSPMDNTATEITLKELKYLSHIYYKIKDKKADIYIFIEDAKGVNAESNYNLALKEIENLLFNIQAFNKISILVPSFNKKFIKVLEEKDYLLEVKARKEIPFEGSYHDVLFYSKFNK